MLDAAQLLVGVFERRERGGLGHGGQVVGHTHDAHAVDDALARGEIADTCAGECERLAHRAADGEVRVVLDERDRARRAGLAELHVRLVDDEDRVDAFARARHVGGLAGGEDAFDVGHRQRRAGGVVRAGEQHHRGLDLGDGLDYPVDVQREIGVAVGELPASERVARVFGVHGVGRVGAQGGAARAAEGLEQLEHNLVGAVRAPQFVHVETGAGFAGEIVGERLAQFDMLAIRVAVERGRDLTYAPGDGVAHGRIRRIRVLVDVQAHRHVELRRAVRLLADQIVPERQARRNHIAVVLTH